MLIRHIRRSIEAVLPKEGYEAVRRIYRRCSEIVLLRQGMTSLRCGNYEILCPKHHPLISFQKTQPLRDLNVGIAALAVSRKYRDATLVDIGANIGDTAAIIASYCKNKLILIEASDFFFEYLMRNCQQFSNKTVLKKALVGDGNPILGRLQHKAGTAFLVDSKEGELETTKITDVVDGATRLVKIDTDGSDFDIIEASLDWLGSQKPALIFENQIFKLEHLMKANRLLLKLKETGYSNFLVWDDSGRFLTRTSDINTLFDLNKYLLNQMSSDSRMIFGYDILCLSLEDSDISDEISTHYRTQ